MRPKLHWSKGSRPLEMEKTRGHDPLGSLVSKRGIARGPWKRNHVPDIGHAGDKLDHALESQTISAVGAGAILPDIQIPVQFLLGDAELFHAPDQYIEIFFPFRSAYDFPDTRKQDIHSPYG